MLIAESLHDPFAAIVGKPQPEPAPVPKPTWKELLVPILVRMNCSTREDHPDRWYGHLREAGIRDGEGEDAVYWLIDRGRKDNPRAVWPEQFLPYVRELRSWLKKRREKDGET